MSNSKILNRNQNIGFYVSLFGTVLILLWVGYFKFTPTEAAAIKRLVINHPLTFWMYDVMSTQLISNIIGTFEITVAILILIGLKYKQVAKIAAIGVIIIFTMTISYLFTTPDTWKIVDGVQVTNFSLIKDIMYLGFGISFFQYANN